MNATLPWPGDQPGTRRHGPLLLAVALHGGLIAALLHGLQSTLERPEPREVVISLLSLATDSSPVAAPLRPAPMPVRQSTPAVTAAPAVQPPTPQPITQPIPQPSPQVVAQPVPVSHEAPAPVAAVQPVSPASHANAPAQELRSVAVAVPAPAPAQPAPATVTPAVAPAMRGPVTVSGVEYLSPPKVEYPVSARRAGLEGKVMLRLLIDERGTPQRADIQQSSGHARLDEAARNAALRALFKPHVEDGHPMPVYALVPISFSLK